MAYHVVGRKTFLNSEEGEARSRLAHFAADQPLIVGLLAFDGVSAPSLFTALEVFRLANLVAHSQRPRYCPLIISREPQFVTEDGRELKPDLLLAGSTLLDTILIPDGAINYAIDANMEGCLRAQSETARRVVFFSRGVARPASAGVIDNRTVTTHWRAAPELARRHPRIRVDSSLPIARDGKFYSSNSQTTSLQLLLLLVQEDCGKSAALALARELVLPLRPESEPCGLTPAVDLSPETSDRLDELPGWIRQNLTEKLTIEELAQRTCLCPRHFSRLFKMRFRSTPAQFVEAARLSEARQRLLRSRSSVDAISSAVGFQSADAFRRAFARATGVSPNKYRIKSPKSDLSEAA